MWRKAAWALGVAAAMSAGGAFAGTPATPADSGSSGGSSLDSRVTAMEQELEDLKRGQAENTAKSAPAPGTFRAYWNKGIVLETSDKAFVMKVDGRVDWDFGVIRQDSKNKAAFGNIMDGSEFRRLRLEFSGDLYENTYFKAQVDFGGGKVALKDALIGFKGVPLLGKVQAGHFTEPFGLEEITSDKYDTFIEQSLATDTFVPSRNAGLAFFNSAANDRVTYAAGVFRDTGDDGTTVADSGYAFTGRVTALPWYEEDGRKLVHVGVAWRHNQPPTGAATYEVRPEWHASSKKFVSTGSISHVEATDTLGLEAAFVYGPFSAQGEFFQSTVSRESGFSDASFNGCYVEGSYWLTGENQIGRASCRGRV